MKRKEGIPDVIETMPTKISKSHFVWQHEYGYFPLNIALTGKTYSQLLVT